MSHLRSIENIEMSLTGNKLTIEVGG